ncbi:MAG: tRNA adenosine(34) deaminase TadA [Bacillota bacterium]
MALQSDMDETFMLSALEQAERSAAMGEVPVGAVIVKDGRIIAVGCNMKETTNDPTAHAEIQAIRAAAKALQSWRLLDTTMYVTLEPCVMCCGALVHARVRRLVYGAPDPKSGAVDSLFNIVTDERLNHRLEVRGGVLAQRCGDLLREFFRNKR